MEYCGSCISFDESIEGKCNKLNIPCKAGQKTCMYFKKKNDSRAKGSEGGNA